MPPPSSIRNGSPNPISLILDFDSTITKQDTLSSIFTRALRFQKGRNQDLQPAYDTLLKEYLDEYHGFVSSYHPAKTERRSLGEEVAFQRSLKEVEKRSFERVSRSGIFEGIEEIHWKEFGLESVEEGEVMVRKGFGELVERVDREEGKVGIVTVNFQRGFVDGVVETAEECRDSVNIGILGNWSGTDGRMVGDAKGGDVVVSADEKVEVMRGLIERWKEDERRAGGNIVYVGDSGTDMECLTEEGVVGIIMSDDGKGSLMEAFGSVGLDVAHISMYEDGSNLIYWTRDFQEIIESPLFSRS